MPDSPVLDTMVEAVRTEKVDNVEETVRTKKECKAPIAFTEAKIFNI